MRKILILLILAIFRAESANDDLHCEKVENKTPTARLHDHLFCGYNKQRPSFNETTATLIDVHIFPTYFEFAESNDKLDFFSWIHMSWHEPQFVWEPEKYDNIQETHIKYWRIWTPNLMLLNRENHADRNTKMSRSRDCLVFFNGTVNCVVPTKFSSTCEPDHSDWPYDKQHCSIYVISGPAFATEDMIHMRYRDKSVVMDEFKQNQQWSTHITVAGYRNGSSEDGKSSMMINLVLERRGLRLAIVYILPIVVLMIMTLIVVCLNTQSIERVILASVNFIGHLFGLSDLHYYFPTNGTQSVPKLLTFYQASVGTAAFALFSTCLLRKLRETETPAPTWLVRIVSLILCSPVRSLLRLNGVKHKRKAEESGYNGQSAQTPKDRTWDELATILEWISFAVVLLTYIIVLALVLPTRGPRILLLHYWY